MTVAVIFLVALILIASGKEIVWNGTPVEVEVAPEGTVVVNVPCLIKTVWWFPQKTAYAQAKGKTAVFFLTKKDTSAGIICEIGRTYVLNIKVDYKEPEFVGGEWKVHRSDKPRTVILDLKDPVLEEEEEKRIAEKIYMDKEEILAHGRALMVGMVSGKQVEGYVTYRPKKETVIKKEGLEFRLLKIYEGLLKGYIYRVKNTKSMSLCVKEKDFAGKGTVFVYLDAKRQSPACGGFFLVYPGEVFYLYVVQAPKVEEDIVRIPYIRKVETSTEPEKPQEQTDRENVKVEAPPVEELPPVEEFSPR